MLRTLCLGIATAAAALASATPAGAQAQTKVDQRWPNRNAIVARVADLQSIKTPEGIEVQEQVEIGGTRQWISIRGMNRANPVLLVIHGGPGTAMTPASWAYQKPWEDFFTVVNWDQRGVGKNAATADLAALAPTLTRDRMVADGEEMVAYLRKRLQKDKIVVLGFSWGSVIGVRLAQRRPEWLAAYVGVGQSIGGMDKDRYLYARTKELARLKNDQAAIAALDAMAPFPAPDGSTSVESASAIRRYAIQYNGGWYGRNSFDLFYGLADWSPELTSAEVDALGPANAWAGRGIVPTMATFDLRKESPRYKVPFVMLQGRYDLFTAYEPAVQYFRTIKAPKKKLITFERSSHFVMFEEPGRFLQALITEVLPLAGGSPDFAKAPDAP